ncbi:O-antigen ligase family protein [Pseudogemmatithrix spongiicola]|uniref:O-antigen ligase family protein n=1 Tax=Pseudogemmatithrix spongiicola TaxID=3062599 RepID=A0AA49Q759_9BACT|nr:O-antigen ligase family protein [Gemmatimonadaceae bacterium 'strain 138']WKW15358.1 O-antigen ligase family protein [Gemmatimonadaceae bacterium 'strain 318']
MRLGTRSILAAAAPALALGNFGRIPFIELGGRPGAISLLDFALLPLWLLLALTLPGGRRRWRFDAVSKGLLLFLAVAAFTTLLAAPRWDLGMGAWVGSAAFLVRWAMYAGYFLLIVTDPDAEREGEIAWQRFNVVLVVIACFGLFQVVFIPDIGPKMSALTNIPADPQGRRLVSTLFDPQIAGGLLAFGLLFVIARAAEGLPVHRGQLLLLSVALVLTLSRSAILGFLAGIGVIVLARGVPSGLRRLAFGGAALLLPLLPLLLPFAAEFNKLRVDASAVQRLIPWLRSLQLLVDHPVLGVGFNFVSHAQRAYGWRQVGGSDVSMDGGLLFIAVMTGVVGLAAFVGMLIAFWRVARRTWRAASVPPPQRAFAVGAVAATVAIVIQSFFTNTLLGTWLMLPMWLAWGRVVATAQRLRTTAVAGVALLVIFLTGCDPCAGVANCGGPERRVLTGTIISRSTDEPVAGLKVEAEGRIAVTNTVGRWVLELPAGSPTVDVRVGGDSGYVASNVAVSPVQLTGDATELGVWFDRPYFGYIMGFTFRDVMVADPDVRFELDPDLGGGEIVSTAAGGGYRFFAGAAPAAGPVRGTFTVSHPSIGTRRFEGATLVADYALRVANIREWFKVDGTYRYGGNVIDRGSYAASPGTTITFQRTGGLELTQNTVVTTSREGGFFTFDIEPLGRGRVVGDLTFAPPNGRAPYVYRDYVLTTYDSSNVRNLGLFAHGEAWVWVFEVRRAADSSAVTWTPFEFVRTGGLALQFGDVLTGTSNGSGRLLVWSPVPDTGSVTGTLTMRPEGRAPVTVGSFTLRTVAADTQNFAGVQFIPLP